MGIQMLKGPITGLNEQQGPLPLPPEFDRKKFAAKWVKEGTAVAAAAEREYLLGTRFTADGWQVWKYPKGHEMEGRPHVVTLASGKHILLHRDMQVQKDVNAIYGNVGKERLMTERRDGGFQNPESGNAVNDPGLLSDDRLNKLGFVERGEIGGDGDVELNKVTGLTGSGRVQKPALKSKKLG